MLYGAILLRDGLSAYEAVLGVILVGAVVSFLLLLFVSAPYGRFARDGWGARLPERAAWILMEIPSLISIVVTALTGDTGTLLSWVLLAAWCAHYLYRSLVYPFLLPAGRRKSMPVGIMFIAMLFNAGNGFVNGHVLFHQAYASLGEVRPLRLAIGFLIFAYGAYLHVSSDAHLRALRRRGRDGYLIPDRGLFRLVSCPNYLGEIVEWVGFAVASWTLPGLSFALFTLANLLPRAISTHKWYRATFPDYPARRRALIPGIL